VKGKNSREEGVIEEASSIMKKRKRQDDSGSKQEKGRGRGERDKEYIQEPANSTATARERIVIKTRGSLGI
jgi:hypothetical protein